jgi:hypothetical protein
MARAHVGGLHRRACRLGLALCGGVAVVAVGERICVGRCGAWKIEMTSSDLALTVAWKFLCV